MYHDVEEVEEGRKERKKEPEMPNFQEKKDNMVRVLSNLTENFFAFFDFAVKKFCGSSLDYQGWV